MLHTFYVQLYGMVYLKLNVYLSLLGESKISMCVHLLSHLTNYVQFWGPLWTFFSFAFESMNRHIKKLFHGTRDMNYSVSYFNILLFVL